MTGLDDAGTLITSGPAASGPRLSWPVDQLPNAVVGTLGGTSYPRPISAVNIESVAYQAAFTREMLRSTRLPAHPVHPENDKVSRGRALAIRYEGGKVFHVRGAPGLAEFEAELVAFPNADHDDLVDAAGYAADIGGVEFSFGSVRA